MAKKGDLPPQNNGRTKAAAPLEHGASTEILPVDRIRKTSDFLVYFIFSYNLPVFLSLCYNLFVPFKAQGGRYFFYKRIFFKEEYSDTALIFHMDFYYEWICYTKWTDHPKGEMTYKVHKVDGLPKG